MVPRTRRSESRSPSRVGLEPLRRPESLQSWPGSGRLTTSEWPPLRPEPPCGPVPTRFLATGRPARRPTAAAQPGRPRGPRRGGRPPVPKRPLRRRPSHPVLFSELQNFSLSQSELQNFLIVSLPHCGHPTTRSRLLICLRQGFFAWALPWHPRPSGVYCSPRRGRFPEVSVTTAGLLGFCPSQPFSPPPRPRLCRRSFLTAALDLVLSRKRKGRCAVAGGALSDFFPLLWAAAGASQAWAAQKKLVTKDCSTTREITARYKKYVRKHPLY